MESARLKTTYNQKNYTKITDWILNFNNKNENDLSSSIEKKPNVFVTKTSTKMVVPDITIHTIPGTNVN